MVLGISSFTYGWAVGETNAINSMIDEITLLERTISFGLRCLQIGDNLPLHLLPRHRLANLRDISAMNRIRLEVGARRLTPENLIQYIDIASFLNARLLRFITDDGDYRPSQEEVAAIVRNALPRLTEYNIFLTLENHDRFKAKELASIVGAVDDERFGISLDCVNSIGAGEGFEWVSSVLIPYTINLHIKDFVIERVPYKMGFTVKGSPLGKGMLDVQHLMLELQKHGRCQSAILEQWVEPDTTVASTIKKEARWAEEGIQYLKAMDVTK